MIVDDEADICYILSLELKRLGHETIHFKSAIDAQTFLKSETPDAILCDFQMPKMNGLELFLWLKDQKRNIPFYILTGEPSMEKNKLMGQGVTDILYKPQDLLRLADFFK